MFVTFALTAASLADFAGMYVDTSDSVCLNGTSHRSHRVYAVFTDSTDRVISVSGAAPIGGPDLEFSVIGSGSLYRECVGASICETVDANGGCALTAFGIVAEPYSSFLCIRGSNDPLGFPPFGDDVSSLTGSDELFFSPDVFCSADPQVTISGSSWSTNGVFGGYLTNNPASGLHEGQLVLLGQFTLPALDEFTLQGVIDYTLVDPNGPSGNLQVSEPFSVSSSDFTGLSDCLNFEDFFTSFTQAVADDPSQEWDFCEDGIFDFCQGIDYENIGLDDPRDDCDFDLVNDLCQYDTEYMDRNDNLVKDTCECIADVDGDGVSLSDVVTLLFAWGDTSPGDLDVVATGTSKGVIDDEDLNVVLAAAVPPATIDPNDENYPFLSGCGLLPDPSPSPLPAESGDGDDPKGQPSMTREQISDGLASDTSSLSVTLSAILDSGSTVDPKVDRKIDDEAELQQLRKAQDSPLPHESQASNNDDALASLFDIIEVSGQSQASKDNAVWDLDQDGLLDPWSVITLPLSSWPEELRPFAELLLP